MHGRIHRVPRQMPGVDVAFRDVELVAVEENLHLDHLPLAVEAHEFQVFGFVVLAWGGESMGGEEEKGE